MKQESLKFSGRASNPATKKFSPAQIAAQKLFAERARAGTLGKTVKRNPVKKNPVEGKSIFNLGGGYFGSVSMSGYNEYYAQVFYRTTDASGSTDDQIVPDYKPRYFVSAKSAVNSLMRYKTKNLGRKTNPDKAKPRAYVKRASQATGAPPSKRLVTRRKKALSAPAGYFPNPEPSHDFARIGKPFLFDGRTWKVSQYSHNGKTIEAYTTDRKKFIRREFDVSELMMTRRKTNPMVKYTNRAKDLKGDQRVGYAVHMADRPSYQAIAWFSKKDDAVKVAQEASDRTGKQLAVTRVQNYFGAM